MEETSPPAVQTPQTSTPSTIRHQQKPQTTEITPSPIIMRPTTPPPSPDSPPSKKKRTKSPKLTRQPKEYFHVDTPSAWEVWSQGHPHHHPQGHRDSIKTAQGRRINIDLPAYFVFHRENALATRQRAHQQVLRWPMVHHHRDADRGKQYTADKHSILVRCPGRILSRSLRGRWRTTANSARAAKLPWHDLL